MDLDAKSPVKLMAAVCLIPSVILSISALKDNYIFVAGEAHLMQLH